MSSLPALAICLALLLACASVNPTATAVPTGKSYYVSTQGNDANPGTQALPFKTIGKAAAVVVAGDTVLIRGGTYYEDVKPQNSGEPDNYIVYQAAGDGEVVIDAQQGQRDACIEINGKSYLRFDGLTVRGASSSVAWPRAGVSISDGSEHIILDHITAYQNYFGILARGHDKPVSAITVQNSSTVGPGNVGNTHYGIFFYEKVYDSAILNNRAAYSLPEEQSYGIEISTEYPGVQADGARRIVVSGNQVYHNESLGIHTWNASGVLISGNNAHDNGATGIQIEDGSENIVIEDNLSANNAQAYEFEAGAWVDNAKNVLVRDNTLMSNKVGLLITKSSRVIVHDNLVVLNNRGAENLDNAAGLIAEDSVSNVAVTHNTFYRNGASTGEHGGVNFGLFHPVCSGIVFENNIVADTAGTLDLLQDGCSGFVSDFNDFSNSRPLTVSWNQAEMDWPTYLAQTGQDAHSLTSAPMFANPDEFDFSLQPGSPLIGSGMVLTRTTSGGSGRQVPVTDAGFFSDGFVVGAGDILSIGSHRVRIVSIDYASSLIGIDQDITWEQNAPVSFPFSGSAPALGAGIHK